MLFLLQMVFFPHVSPCCFGCFLSCLGTANGHLGHISLGVWGLTFFVSHI
jgi:hypothetical protein